MITKIILLIFCFFSCSILILQYYFNTPYFENSLLVANFYEGFLNGYCLFINAILYLLHNLELVDTSFYFFDYPNANPEYLNGFVFGLFINLFSTIICKILNIKIIN